MPNNTKIEEIRSDEVQEILSRVPNWMIRWGITLIFGLIVLVLFISWFVKYPDVVTGQVTLTSKNPPALLVSQTNGYVSNMFLTNGAEVKVGEIIASIRNPTEESSLDSLVQLVNQENTQKEEIFISKLQSLENLGGVQVDVNNLTTDLIELRNLKTNAFFQESINTLNQQVDYQNRLAWITKQELALLETEISNAKEKFEADSLLYDNQVIAKHTFYTNQSEYFAKRQQIISVKRSYVQNKIAASNLSSKKNELLKTNADLIRQIESRIEASKRNILTYADNWQQNYIFKAPQNGKLSYLTHLTVNDYVTVKQELFAVIPSEEEIIGVVKVADQAFGKVEIGQKVRMSFANYPAHEFGQLLGKVNEISSIPSEDGYFIKVNLTDGLNTSYQKSINYQPQMIGTAEIVTKDLRLIERVFNNFRRILDR